MLATGVLGVIVAVAALLCRLSSICTASSLGANDNTTASYALIALVSLAIAVGGVMLIAKLNRKL
jgi:hypothetical protein